MAFPRKLHQLRSTILIMCFSLFLVLPQTCSAQGEPYSCEVEFEEMCITKVTWNIPETYVKEGKHFTVSYVTTDGKTEKAVALHNVGHYICDAVGDHTCTQDSPGTSAAINSVTSCVTGRLYILAADGEKGFPCTPAQNGRKPDVKIEVSVEDSNAPCSPDTPVVSDEANSRNKRKASGEKCKEKLSDQEEAFQSGEADKMVIGISCGVATLVILLIAGVTFYFIKRRYATRYSLWLTPCVCGCSYEEIPWDSLIKYVDLYDSERQKPANTRPRVEQDL